MDISDLTPTPESPFAHGPYTTEEPTNIADSVPSHFPDRAQRRNPKHDLAALGVLLLIMIALSLYMGARVWGDKQAQPERKSLPVCELEDGSTQKACIFPADRGALINLDYGRYTYDTVNNTITDYGKK